MSGVDQPAGAPVPSALERLAELSRWAAARERVAETHSYGNHPDQVADLLIPEGDGPHPVAMLLHGGFWRPSFTRSSTVALAVSLAERGWASWNVEYRRGDGVEAMLSDVRAARAHLRAVPGPLDTARLVVIGHSAGGHLALCTAPSAGADLTISLAGVSDLVAAAQDDLGAGAAVALIGAGPAEAPERYAAVSPITALPSGVRVLLVHGDRDDRVPISQSRRYRSAAEAAGDVCELLELPGVDHFDVIDPRVAAVAAYLEWLPSGPVR